MATTNDFVESPEQAKVKPGQFPNPIADNNMINSDVLSGNQGLFNAPTRTDNTNWASIMAGLNNIATSAKTLQEQQAKDGGLYSLFKKYMGDQEAPPNYATDYTTALGTTPEGIVTNEQDNRKLVKNLTDQLNAIVAETQVQNLALDQKGQTQGVVDKMTNANIRESAIRAIPVSVALASAQGNLALASQQAERFFELQQIDKTNTYNYNKDLRDKIYNYADKTEQREFDRLQKEDDRAFTTQQNNLNQAQTWATTAISQGQGQLASQIMALDPNDKDYQVKLGQLAGQVKAKPTGGSGGGTTPMSYREWELAGGEKGTGKTYAQWVGSKTTVKAGWGEINSATGKTPEQGFIDMGISQEMIDTAKSIGLTPADLF